VHVYAGMEGGAENEADIALYDPQAATWLLQPRRLILPLRGRARGWTLRWDGETHPTFFFFFFFFSRLVFRFMKKCSFGLIEMKLRILPLPP